MSSNPQKAQPTLARRLGLTSAVMITVGAVIGSGIFLKPLDVAQSLPSPLWILIAWIGIGIVCLFGAFAYAELGSMYPEAGGQYAFLREGWGRFIAFLYGWCFLWVINSGTLAALAVAFADQLGVLWPMSSSMHLVAALAMIAVLGLVNHFGVVLGAWLQNVSTFAKLAALALLAGGAFFAAGHASGVPAEVATATGTSLSVVTGLCAIFWAYEGWYQLPFNAAELKRPERDLPRGLVFGMAILIVIYALVNSAYLWIIPVDEMRTFATKEDVPRTFVERVFGGGFANPLTVLICISVFGSANPNLLSSPRAFYAMAQDRLLPRALVHVDPRWRTPTTAIWLQAVWAGVLVWWLEQKFSDITAFVVFAALGFYALAVGAVFVLRRRLPDAPRTYRCGAYPIGPILFILVVLAVDVALLCDEQEQKNALWGLAIVSTGIPAYLLMRRRA